MTETADPRVIEIDQFYPHPPQRVWQALTTPELMARWLMEPTLHPEGAGTRVILRHSGFDPDDAVQQRSRTIMGSGWVRIAGQLGEVLGG